MTTPTPRFLPLALALVLSACGGSGDDGEGNPGGGGRQVDDSCGLDCQAQGYFGLTLGRCFEYSDDPAGALQEPPALGVEVMPVERLEGEVKTIPVQYNTSGLIRLTDHFLLTDGELWLARRSFTAPAGSVSYEDDSGALVGVRWMGQTPTLPSTVSTQARAKVVGEAGGAAGETTLRVDLKVPDATKLQVPAGTYESGTELLLLETPDHGSDPRRFFVENVGFVRLFADFKSGPGTATEYKLQRIRDVAPGDTECGL